VLTVACYLWDGQPADNRTRYTTEHVRVLAAMCRRHLPEHRFVCMADRFVPDVETWRLSDDWLRWGKRYPKLSLWRGDAGRVFGDRVLCLDLDCVIVDDLAPLVTRTEEVVIWRDPGGSRLGRYNTSMVLLTPGARPEVWDTFDPGAPPVPGVGSDQAWVSHVLGDGVATWGPEDGVYSYRWEAREEMPDNARAVFFHGKPKPWEVQGWPAEHWRAA
jgi:hypothetical protein